MTDGPAVLGIAEWRELDFRRTNRSLAEALTELAGGRKNRRAGPRSRRRSAGRRDESAQLVDRGGKFRGNGVADVGEVAGGVAGGLIWRFAEEIRFWGWKFQGIEISIDPEMPLQR